MITVVSILICALSILFAGCGPIMTIRNDGSTVKHYMGYVRVIDPPTTGTHEQFNVSEIEAVGVRIEKGFGIGYFHERNEFIPLDCRMVVRVANKGQMDKFLEIISAGDTKYSNFKEGLCVTVSPQ